jgi:hypothetical protein
MKQRYYSGSLTDAARREAAKVGALIDELDRRVRIIESDIAREEAAAGVSDPVNAAYPILARMMIARRDNLKQTMAALAQRLASEQAQRA